MLSAITKK